MKKALFTLAALAVASSASALTISPVLAIQQVPDGGATLALLGGAVAGLGAVRYFLGK